MRLSKSFWRAPILMLVLFALGSAVAPAMGQPPTVHVVTDMPSYSGNANIKISGSVSPAPTIPTAVIVTVFNPENAIVDIESYSVSTITGEFNGATVAGGTANWIAGTYLVNATWGGSGEAATTTTTFTYNPAASSTSSSSSSSSSSSTSSSSSSSSTTTSSSVASSSSSTTSSMTSSSSVSTPPPTSTSSTTTSTSSSTTSSGGSNTIYYILAAVVVVVVAVIGVFFWRRRVASTYGAQAR